MSLKIDRVQLEIIIDNDQARKQMHALDEELRSLQREQKKLIKDSEEWKRNEARINAVKKQMEGLKREIGITGMTLKELTAHQKELNMVLQKMRPGTKEFNVLQAELKETTARIKELKGHATEAKLSLGGIANGFNKYFGMATAAIASFTGVAFGIKKAVDAFNEFESKVAELSALTGLAGEDLKWLSDKAKELSVSVTDAGVRITSSSVDIVDGFKLMGSARPELLKNKEALAQVTEGALVLAEAAKIDMQSAVNAVAASMNQFNLDATQTDRVINAIAAGALEGSAEIADLTESMANVGTVADQSNMSLEQTVAALEVLSAKQLKGAEAGTQLRGALLNMKQASVGYQSGAFNLRDALEEVNGKLAAMGSDMERDAMLQKIFGDRNITVGNILLQNINTYDKLTTAVTGTNVAIEQAQKNTDTNAAKLAQAKNRAHEVAVELGEKLAPAMTIVTGWGTKMLKAISAIIDIFVKYKSFIISAAVGIGVYTLAVKGAEIAEKAYEAATKLATLATKAFNTAMKSSPWGAIASLVAMAIVALAQYASNLNRVSKVEQAHAKTLKDIEDLRKRYAEQYVEENTKMNLAFNAATKDNISKVERKKAIKALIDQFPEYAKNLNAEKSSIEDIKKIQNEANQGLKDKLWLQMVGEEAAIIAKAQKELEDHVSGLNIYKEALNNTINGVSGASKELTDNAQKYAENLKPELFYSANIKSEEDMILLRKKALGVIEDEIIKSQELSKIKQKEFDLTENKYSKLLSKQTHLNNDPNDPNTNIGGKSKAEQAAEEKLQKEIQYLKNLAEVGQQIYEMTLKEGEEKEMVAAMQKYDRLREMAYGNAELEKQLYELQDREVAQIHKKWLDKELMDKKEAELKKMDLENQSIEARLSMERDFYAQKKQLLENYFNTELDLSNSLSNIVSTIKDIELEKAGDNEKKKKEINKKYADIEMGITISKIIAETALAAMKAWATSSIVGGIMSALIIGEGAAQVAMAVAQRNKIRGLEKGFYPASIMATRAQDGKKFKSKVSSDTSTRLINEPTILVGEQGKKGLPELIIDGQTLKRLEINAPMAIQAIAHEAGKTHGFEKGFYDNLKNIGNRSVEEIQIIKDFTSVMRDAINNGLHTKLSIYDFEKSQSKYNEAKKTFS